MPKAYSQDLRIRAINYLKEGKKQIEVAKILKIGVASVKRWWHLYRKYGNILPRRPIQTRPRATNYDKIILYVNQNPDSTLKEIASAFNISDFAVHYALKSCNYTYKKTVPLYRKKGRVKGGIHKTTRNYSG